MPQAQRPPRMAEVRAMQEQLPACERAAHLRTNAFTHSVAGMARSYRGQAAKLLIHCAISAAPLVSTTVVPIGGI